MQTAFPEALKARLLENNGGAECLASGEHWYLFAVKDTRSRKHITRTANHIERETKSARQSYGFPENAIAIANNGGGDYLLILPNDETIYIWHHECDALHVTELRDVDF